MVKVNKHVLTQVLEMYRRNVTCYKCPFRYDCESDTGAECVNEVYKLLTEEPLDK